MNEHFPGILHSCTPLHVRLPYSELNISHRSGLASLSIKVVRFRYTKTVHQVKCNPRHPAQPQIDLPYSSRYDNHVASPLFQALRQLSAIRALSTPADDAQS